MNTTNNEMILQRKSLFVGVDEIMNDIGCSKSKAYAIVRKLSEDLHKENPKALIVHGKINRAYYEQVCLVR